MTRNDTFFKILFAIEIALLPMAMAAFLMMPEWSVGIFVAGILVTKIWMELFKNKDDFIHVIINAIGNALTISTLVIFFTVKGYIGVAVCVFTVIAAVLMNALLVLTNKNTMPEMIDAVDTCYMLFEGLTLAGLTFVMFYGLITDIALFALVLTALVSVGYRLFYLYRQYDVTNKIKTLFARLFRRK